MSAKLKHIPRSKKLLLKRIGLFIGLLIILAGIFTAIQYQSYRHGNRTSLFGSKDTYYQNQTLHIYNLDVWVTNIKLNNYPVPKQPDVQQCLSEIPVDTNNAYENFGLDFRRNHCYSLQGDYTYNLKQHADSRELRVDFGYKNVVSHPINMSNYHFQLTANTDIFPSNCPVKEGTLLNGSALFSCFWTPLPKTYKGPISLIVKSGGKQKQISLQPTY
jgi:hypothetical protein